MKHPSNTSLDLTKNQALVLDTLTVTAGPLSAYSILENLREAGLRAPLQVYRALDKLVELGIVHRLESMNAFVACRHPACADHQSIAFAICEKCEQVAELAAPDLEEQLQRLGVSAGFDLRKSTVELRGMCKACRTT